VYKGLVRFDVSVSSDHWFCVVSFVEFILSVPSQEIGWEERLGNDLFCVEWDVKPCSVHPFAAVSSAAVLFVQCTHAEHATSDVA